VFSELMFINCTKLTFFAFYKLQNYMWVRPISLLFLRFKTHQGHPSPSFGPHLICEHRRRTHFFLWIGPHLISLTLVLSCRSLTGPSPATRAPHRAILWVRPRPQRLARQVPLLSTVLTVKTTSCLSRGEPLETVPPREAGARWPRHGRAPHAS
jgi:hypothetical protein